MQTNGRNQDLIPDSHLEGSIQGVSEALLDATLRNLPVAPERISNLEGPTLEVTKVDAHTADVKIIHGFRAHFRASMKKRLPSEEEEFQNCLIRAPGEQLKKRVLQRRSLSFSDLADLDKDCAGALEDDCTSQWEIDPAKIKLGRRIAVGGFAEVFIAEYQGTKVAVKRMFDRDATAIEQFKQEISILARLRHPNLILFMGYCLTPEPSMVSEFMQKGCLYNILREHDGCPLSEAHAQVVLVSVARGMAYLHSRDPPILHLDLKSPNILIDASWRVKITDFGLSRFRSRTLVSGNAGSHGTPHWMAPETIRGEQIDEKSDVYSFGVILWELLTGQIPWNKLNPIQVIAAVGFKGRKLPTPSHSEAVLISLMEHCFADGPQDRPSFGEILAVLDAHYGRPGGIQSLKLEGGETSESPEPMSPAVGTVVEITSVTGPSTPVEATQQRSVDRLEAFEENLRSRRSGPVAAVASPFAQFAATPIEGSSPGDEEELMEIRSCDAMIEGGVPDPSVSPFAAFSAMPFVDSGHLHGEAPAVPFRLKSQKSSVYDDAVDPGSERGSARISLFVEV